MLGYVINDMKAYYVYRCVYIHDIHVAFYNIDIYLVLFAGFSMQIQCIVGLPSAPVFPGLGRGGYRSC